MELVQEATHAGEFLLSEAIGGRSRESITVTGGRYPAGTVLALVLPGAIAAAVADAGNVGDGVLSAITLNDKAAPGSYQLSFIEGEANAGKFNVEGPDGKLLGVGTVGTAYNKKGLMFTLSDGATDFALTDSFAITVEPAATGGAYTGYDPAAHNAPDMILYREVNATAADQKGLGVARDAELVNTLLAWKAGISDDDKQAGLAALKKQGLIAR